MHGYQRIQGILVELFILAVIMDKCTCTMGKILLKKYICIQMNESRTEYQNKISVFFNQC